MPATISIQPYVTTTSQLSFQLQTDGFVQGFFQDSPVTRYALEGGVVSALQTTPIWGGLPLSLVVPFVTVNNAPRIAVNASNIIGKGRFDASSSLKPERSVKYAFSPNTCQGRRSWFKIRVGLRYRVCLQQPV